MTLHTYLTHSDPYLFIRIEDRNGFYYEGYAGTCHKKELWDREILKVSKGRFKTIVKLRIRRSRYIHG